MGTASGSLVHLRIMTRGICLVFFILLRPIKAASLLEESRQEESDPVSTVAANEAVLLRCLVPAHDHQVLVARWGSNGTHFWVELQAQTSGWVAFGISPNGKMDKSDILFAWCDRGGYCYAQNRYVNVDVKNQRVNLTTDTVQEWKLIRGYENSTHTVITAARTLLTDDANHYPITPVITAIYAVGSSDPDVNTGEVLKHVYKGSRRLVVSSLEHISSIEPTRPTQNTHSRKETRRRPFIAPDLSYLTLGRPEKPGPTVESSHEDTSTQVYQNTLDENTEIKIELIQSKDGKHSAVEENGHTEDQGGEQKEVNSLKPFITDERSDLLNKPERVPEESPYVRVSIQEHDGDLQPKATLSPRRTSTEVPLAILQNGEKEEPGDSEEKEEATIGQMVSKAMNRLSSLVGWFSSLPVSSLEN